MRDKGSDIIIFFFGGIIVIYFALLLTPIINTGLGGLIKEFPSVIREPFSINFSIESIKVVFISLLIYVLVLTIYLSTKKIIEEEKNMVRQNGEVRIKLIKNINKNHLLIIKY